MPLPWDRSTHAEDGRVTGRCGFHYVKDKRRDRDPFADLGSDHVDMIHKNSRDTDTTRKRKSSSYKG